MKIIVFSFAFFLILITKISTLKLDMNQVSNVNRNLEANLSSNINANIGDGIKSSKDDNNFSIENPHVNGILQEYKSNPLDFISRHNNKENFLAVVSNYTRTDASDIFRQYSDSNKKEIQNVIDKINNIQNNYVFNWEYDVQKKKFILPDEIKNLDDFNKWLLIMSILRTMDDVPFKYALENANKNDAIVNRLQIQNQYGVDKFEQYRMKESGFLQNDFDILNPPNI